MTTTQAPPVGVLRSLFSAMRPWQWVKNCLIIIAPAAAGTVTHAAVLRATALAFLAFCAVSSGVYLLNDVRDREADRRHPTKRFRAIASGRLATSTAITAGLVLLALGFLIASLVVHPGELLIVVASYVAVTLAYVYWIKDVAIVELGAVAGGFFLRAYAGAAASHIPVSTWFLVVISFGALFLVTVKRSSELKSHGDVATRRVLGEYSASFLDSVLTMSATIVVAGYCLWAFDGSSTGLSANHDATLPIRLSVVPVVFAMLFILRFADAGHGAAPEDLLLHNRTVQVLLVIWAVLMIFSVYE
ncbi:MAG: phosphoribose diphosphate--decaprenyl-phosphate phosphoribosyltransferase [Acidimicrobiaceae bacterium]|nr:phosphoribose diphosphate--decaprenyl-phosphate phosphoribosyltransferase [Acidimicrobiaceae bacterium]